MASGLTPSKWQELKRDLMLKWRELSENDLESTRGESRSIIDLMERKLGVAFEEASEKFEEVASRYRLYDEPSDETLTEANEKNKRVLELRPKNPANVDRKPKNPISP